MIHSLDTPCANCDFDYGQHQVTRCPSGTSKFSPKTTPLSVQNYLGRNMPKSEDICQNCGDRYGKHNAAYDYCPSPRGGYNFMKRFYPKVEMRILFSYDIEVPKCVGCGETHPKGTHCHSSRCLMCQGNVCYCVDKSNLIPISNQKFWMVNGGGEKGSVVRHTTWDGAYKEATRLARTHPGKTFTILVGVKSITYSALNETTLI